MVNNSETINDEDDHNTIEERLLLRWRRAMKASTIRLETPEPLAHLASAAACFCHSAEPSHLVFCFVRELSTTSGLDNSFRANRLGYDDFDSTWRLVFV
jgi:hypothetical protein